MDAQTISCMVIAGVGIGMILLSIPFFLRLKKIRRKCSEMTTGKVIDYYVKRNGDMGSSIAPIVEYSVNGKTYKAYRRYKGIKSVKKIPPKQSGNTEQSTFYISKNDWFCKTQNGQVANLSFQAKEMWPIDSELPVVYNPDKPKQAYVEKVVGISNIAGIVLASAGAGFVLLAGIVFMIASMV